MHPSGADWRRCQEIGSPRSRSERGVTMLSTVIVVVILGIVGTVAVTSRPSSLPSSPPDKPSSPTSVAPTAKTVGSDTQVSTLAACEANFATISTALSTYRALHGAPPPEGTAWATSSVGGAPILHSLATSANGYQIEWNGVTLNVVPTTGTPSRGSIGTPSPPTGCFAG